MFQKSLMTVLLILFALSLSASTCSRIVINDHEICGDKGSLGASCFHMLSDGHRYLDFDSWAQERLGQLCLKAEAFANFKEALLKLCEQTKRCTWEEIQNINALSEKVSYFQNDI